MNREKINLIAQIIASDTDELWELASNKGIVKYHPALGIWKSILCEIEVPNSNQVRLSKKATEEAVSTLIGCQVNRNHLRQGNILGYIFDAWINKSNEIEIACIFFKDIYADEYEEAMELFNKNKLTMSFELSADVESQDKLKDGTRRINDYYFIGAGLLFGEKPACSKARVFEMATRKFQEQIQLERQSLIFANNINTKQTIMGVLSRMTKQLEQANQTVETPQEQINVTPLAETPKEETQVIEQSTEESPIVEQSNVEVPAVEQVITEPLSEQATIVITTETTRQTTDVIEPGQSEQITTIEQTIVENVNDETNTTSTVENISITVQTYTQEQVEEKVSEATAPLQAKIQELEQALQNKNSEIESIKANAEKLGKRKAELVNNVFAKDFTDADYLDDVKVENATLKQERQIKEQELVQAKKHEDLNTGHEEMKINKQNSLVEILKSRRQNNK